MANTFHQNLKQSFANFKAKYIGNVPSGVTVAQINNKLTELERRGAMPKLDRSNPVHMFGTTSESYTVLTDSYLEIGNVRGASGASAAIKINGVMVSNYYRGTEGAVTTTRMGIIALKAGDIVATTLSGTINTGDFVVGVYNAI